MSVKVYRCGWCGSATTESGVVLSPEEANAIVDADWGNAVSVNGDCCRYSNAHSREEELRRSEYHEEMMLDAYGPKHGF